MAEVVLQGVHDFVVVGVVPEVDSQTGVANVLAALLLVLDVDCILSRAGFLGALGEGGVELDAAEGGRDPSCCQQGDGGLGGVLHGDLSEWVCWSCRLL